MFQDRFDQKRQGGGGGWYRGGGGGGGGGGGRGGYDRRPWGDRNDNRDRGDRSNPVERERDTAAAV